MTMQQANHSIYTIRDGLPRAAHLLLYLYKSSSIIPPIHNYGTPYVSSQAQWSPDPWCV